MLFIDPRYLDRPEYRLHGHSHPHEWTPDCSLVAPACVPCDGSSPLLSVGDDPTDALTDADDTSAAHALRDFKDFATGRTVDESTAEWAIRLLEEWKEGQR